MPTLDEAIENALASLNSEESNQEQATDVEPEEGTLDEAIDAEDEGEPEDGDEEADEGGEPVELTDDQMVTIGGKTGTVKDLLMRQADYTRKTQELARKTEEVEARASEVEQAYENLRDWYEAKVSDPIAWVSELAESTGDVDAFFATLTKSWAEQGLLSAELLAIFGLTKSENPVNRKAQRSEDDARIAQLEERLREREEREASDARQRQLFAEYERQVQAVIAEEGLTFDSDEALQEFRVELFTFAKEHDLTESLEVAYAVMQRQRSKAERQRQAQLAEAAAKKRRTQVVSSKPGAAKGSAAAKQKVSSYEDAASAALARLEAEGRL